MHKEHAVNGLRWIHITKPTRDDFVFLNSVFTYHPLVKEAIVSPTLHPTLDTFDDHMFLVMHFPLIDRGISANRLGEVDFLITKDILVTISYLNYRSLEEIFQTFRQNPGLLSDVQQKHTGYLLHHVIDRLFQKLAGDLNYLEEEITRIEDKIFKKSNRHLVQEISHIQRDVLDFHRWLKPQSAVLKRLIEKGEVFFGKGISHYFADLLSMEERFENIVENQRDTIGALHRTNESLLSSNLNSIIVVLTVFSAIIMPLNFVASIWGMNHQYLPLRDGPYDFWIVMGLMALIMIGALVVFRRRSWL